MRAHLIRKVPFGACLILVATAHPAAAQTNGRLTVREAIDRAFDASPILKQIDARIHAKSGDILAQTSPPAPRLAYAEEGIPLGAPAGFAERRWTVSQNLDFPLRILYRFNRLSGERTTLEIEHEAASVRLRADVKKAYARVAHAIGVERLRKDELALVRQLRDAVQMRKESGSVSDIEVYKAEIAFADAENDLDEAERALHRARYALFTMMGLTETDDLYSLVFPDTLAFIETKVPQEQVVEDVTRLPEARMHRESIDAARSGIAEAWSSLLPDLDLLYFRQNFGDGMNHYGVELGISLPLWFLIDHRGRIMAANAARDEAEALLTHAELELKREVEDTWHAYESSRRTIERYRDIMRVTAPSLIELTLESYRAGQTDLLNLLDAQRTYQNSRKRYLDMMLDYYEQMIELERFLPSEIVFGS